MHSTLIFVIITSLAAVQVEVSGLKVSFNGSQFIPFIHGNATTDDTNISLRVRTIKSTGVLIYGVGLKREIFLLDIIQGRLRLVIDLGEKRHEALLGYNLANNRWHSATITQSQNMFLMSLDNQKSTRLLTGSPVHLDLQNPIYIGGLDRSLVGKNFDTSNFIGCLSEVYINYINVLHGATYQISRNTTTTAPLKLSCPRDNGLVEFPSRKSHIRLSLSSSPLRFSLRLSFRTYTKSGVIAYRAATNAHAFISLTEGALELKVKVANVPAINITIGKNLNNGEWHDVTSGVSTNELWLSLDDLPEERRSHGYLGNIGRFQSHFFVGGGRETRGFIGCMNNIMLNGILITSRKSYISYGVAVKRCSLKSFCLPNPCKNDGKCKRQKDGFTCDCGGLLYDGNHCEIPLYRATCTEYKNLGLSEDSYCKVNPEGSITNSFIVLCDVTFLNRVVTVITHDKKAPHKVSEGTSQHNGFHYHTIKYNHANKLNIKSLISKSKRCRQYISFHCFNTTLLDPPNVWWLSGNGVAQNYWGGAQSESHKCACAVTSTCVDGSKFCNCDVGDAKWREDAGYITDKAALPVILLEFTHQASQSMYTLGPLECFGFNGKSRSAKNVTAASFISQACRPINPRPTLRSTRQNPTVWSSISSVLSISKMILESATMATSITNTLTRKVNTVQKESTSLPLVTSGVIEPAITTELRNDIKKHVPKEESSGSKLSRNDILLIIICFSVIIVLALLVGVAFAVRRGVCGNSCCVSQRSHNDGRVPDKSISHAIYSGSATESVRPVSMEMGTYNVNSGQWLYQSVDQSGVVKEFVTFAPMSEESADL